MDELGDLLAQWIVCGLQQRLAGEYQKEERKAAGGSDNSPLLRH